MSSANRRAAMIEQGLEARLGIYDPALLNRATCLCIVGTRPEVIKMAPVVQKLQEADWIHPVLVTTGQHVELLEIALEDFSLTPDTQLVVDRSSESFNSVLAQVIDALLAMAERDPGPPDNFPQVARPILVTAHRRENIGDGLRSAFEGLRHIADRFEDVGIFFPVHPNPGTREAAHAILGGHPRIVLMEPLSYREMVACLKRSWLVITDSGGL
jgi:UDP-N-acetylglucosamine 2-epimerase